MVVGAVELGAVEGVALPIAPESALAAATSAAAALSTSAVAGSPRARPQPIMTAALNVSPAAVIITRRRLVALFIWITTPIDRFTAAPGAMA